MFVFRMSMLHFIYTMPYNLHNGKSTGECNRKIIRKYISIVEKTLIICCHMIKSIVKKCLGIVLTSVSKYEDKKFMLHCRKALLIFLYALWFHRKIAR